MTKIIDKNLNKKIAGHILTKIKFSKCTKIPLNHMRDLDINIY